MTDFRQPLRELRDAEGLASEAAKSFYARWLDLTPGQAASFGRWLTIQPRIQTILFTSKTPEDFKRDFHLFMRTPVAEGGNKQKDSTEWKTKTFSYKTARSAREANQTEGAQRIGREQLVEATQRADAAREQMILDEAREVMQLADEACGFDDRELNKLAAEACELDTPELLSAAAQLERELDASIRPPIVLKPRQSTSQSIRAPIVLKPGPKRPAPSSNELDDETREKWKSMRKFL